MEFRLFIWTIVTVLFIGFYPILRKLLNWRYSQFNKNFLRNWMFFNVMSISSSIAYFNDIIENAELMFILFLIIILYLNSSFNYTILVVYSYSNSTVINLDALGKLSKGMGGSSPVLDDGIYNFSLTTPYRLKYDVSIHKDKKILFQLSTSSSNIRYYKVLSLLGFYLILSSMLASSEIVQFPLLGFDISGVLATLICMGLTVIISYVEINECSNLATDLPKIYDKLIQKQVLSSIHGTPERESITIKDKAKSIIDKRESNVIQAKKSELQKKLDSVFGTKTSKGIEPETIARIRLMETVKRILNSTPPWKTVPLKDIVDLADGDEEEIEKIIAGLIDLKEVKGIYDIWEKTYNGAPISHWFITKMMNGISSANTQLENIHFYPDGSAEFSVSKEKDTHQTTKKKSN
ncbi:MAG: hypothetical protein OEZ01_13580 [Candidatus Heimdallarchaeota archaeon]|nr:hypothetical protein [Candidatus Heimdallarchaeota archaeon]MDH5647039.1 hypothetical protein [Candidatus Heimdallarchaeota archaeon]